MFFLVADMGPHRFQVTQRNLFLLEQLLNGENTYRILIFELLIGFTCCTIITNFLLVATGLCV